MRRSILFILASLCLLGLQAHALAQSVDRELVAVVQKNLSILGYRPGPADGVMGQRTKSAMHAFQQEQGLPVTSMPTAALAEKLQTRVDELAAGHRGRRVADASSQSVRPRPSAAESAAAQELFSQGFNFYQEGNFSHAKERFEIGLKLDPSNVTALYYLGKTLEQQGEFQSARKAYSDAIKVAPNSKEGILAKIELDGLFVREEQAKWLIIGPILKRIDGIWCSPKLNKHLVNDKWVFRAHIIAIKTDETGIQDLRYSHVQSSFECSDLEASCRAKLHASGEKEYWWKQRPALPIYIRDIDKTTKQVIGINGNIFNVDIKNIPLRTSGKPHIVGLNYDIHADEITLVAIYEEEDLELAHLSSLPRCQDPYYLQ